MAGKGGGAWKVAYADFVTAMMAFFMVMWLVGQKDSAKEAIAEHFQHDPLEELFHNESTDPDRESGGPRKGNGRFGKRKGDSSKVRSPSESELDPEDKKARLLMLHDTERTGVGAMVPFAEHSSELSEDGRQKLLELLPLIGGKPHKIEVRGHCSGSPADAATGESPDEFWQLAFSRALAVQHFLESEGVAAERMRLSVAGRYEPFTLEEDKERQVRNERVEVYLLNEFVNDLQGTRAERDRRFQEAPAAPSTQAPVAEAKPKAEPPAAASTAGHGGTEHKAAGKSDPHAASSKSHGKPPAKEAAHGKPAAKDAHGKPAAKPAHGKTEKKDAHGKKSGGH